MPAEKLTGIHASIQERILAEFKEEIKDSSGQVDQKHVDNFLEELQLKYNNFATNNSVKEVRLNASIPL